MTDIDKVKQKLEEYGIEIYSDYELSDNEYVFMVEKMAVFVNEKEHAIGISFHAETRPETAGNYTLILKEIPDLKKIEIMDSFIVDVDNKFISGQKAFDIIQKKMIKQVTNELAKEYSYSELLMSNKCFHC